MENGKEIDGAAPLPGSEGEHRLQETCGTTRRARNFYEKQVLDRLSPLMAEFISRMPFMFISTSDAKGDCDCSYRAGVPGFIRVLDEKTLIYPEYKGNGVMASLGNMMENPHVGIMFIDFMKDRIGLHVNGKARVIENDELLAREDLDDDERSDLEAECEKKGLRWVQVEVEEAYVHCGKHIPLMKPENEDEKVLWGTDKGIPKGGDYFRVKFLERPWTQ